jgi:hypothetical protein
VDTGSREENASEDRIAFSSEVDTGSHEENASEDREPNLLHHGKQTCWQSKAWPGQIVPG